MDFKDVFYRYGAVAIIEIVHSTILGENPDRHQVLFFEVIGGLAPFQEFLNAGTATEQSFLIVGSFDEFYAEKELGVLDQLHESLYG